MSAVSKEVANLHEPQFSSARLIVLHLLPGAVAMMCMLIAGLLLGSIGLSPNLPILFTFVGGPAIIVAQLGFLYHKGMQLNGKYSLEGIVLYRDKPMPWWKTIAWSLPLFAWIAFAFYIVKPPVNGFFIQHYFAWMPAYLFDDYLLNNLNHYSPTVLRGVGFLFILSIGFGGAVEELYFRGYLLPRMEHLGAWAPLANAILFSIYHFWSPWEFIARTLALVPWVYAVWHTRSIYLAILVHFTINIVSGISLLSLIIHLT